MYEQLRECSCLTRDRLGLGLCMYVFVWYVVMSLGYIPDPVTEGTFVFVAPPWIEFSSLFAVSSGSGPAKPARTPKNQRIAT
jgi:hypothetical protein